MSDLREQYKTVDLWIRKACGQNTITPKGYLLQGIEQCYIKQNKSVRNKFRKKIQ